MWCSCPGRGPKAARGGRAAAAGGGHRARPGTTGQRICEEGLTAGALCPGCLYPEGRPSRSLLSPLMRAALGQLPATHSSRVSAKSPSAPSPADVASWAAHSLGLLGLRHSLWGRGPSGNMVGDSHFPTTEISVSTCPSQGKATLVGLHTPPQDCSTHSGAPAARAGAVWSPGCGEDPSFAPHTHSFREERPINSQSESTC